MEHAFVTKTVKDIEENLFQMIGEDWMLITAGYPKTEKYNTMTASWGGTGILWGKPVAFCFIRPQRYTYTFTEAGNHLTLSFFHGKKRDALKLCGSRSGRDCDKITLAGLTPVIEQPYVWFAEAETVLKCTKLYADDIKEACFVDRSLLSNYENKDFHKMYICEITEVLEKIKR